MATQIGTNTMVFPEDGRVVVITFFSDGTETATTTWPDNYSVPSAVYPPNPEPAH